MSFLHNFFSKKQPAAAQSSHPSLQQNIAEQIWERAQNEAALGSVELAGMKIKINLYMWSIAKLKDQQEKIASARKSNARINVTETAGNLFLIGLHVIAGSIKMGGGDFAQFGPVCCSLSKLYDAELKPIAQNIDKGRKPPTQIGMGLALNASETIQFSETQAQELAEIKRKLRNSVSEGMTPLIDFLNSYAG
jgi:hypothetical protein